MKMSDLAWKVVKFTTTLVLSLIALTIVGLVFFTQVKGWIYEVGFSGNDTPQFIHYITYYLKHPHFPVNAWDYFWHNGVPRTVDLTWLHFSLSAFLAKAIGVYQTVKLYPIIALGLGVFFVYLLFYELSRSVLLSLAMAISFVLGQGYYVALFKAGVVLSAISQMFLPAQLYFLARFVRRGTYRNLLLGSVMSALGLYSHGLMMMFFGFIPGFIFVLFANRESDSLISRKTITNAFIFAISTLTVGALAVWPFLLQALQGGSPTTFLGKEASYDPENFKHMFRLADQGIIYGFILSVPIGLAFWLIRKKVDKTVRPILVLLMAYLLWMISYTVGGNPLFGVLFPGRIFWIWPLLLGCLACAFLAPLSKYEAHKLSLKGVKFLGFSLLKLVVFVAIMFNPFIYFGNRDNFLAQIKKPQKWENFNISERYREGQKDLLTIVDPNEKNIRLWSHDNGINLSWIATSDIPLSEGYAHIWTYYSRLWEGWFYGVMASPNWESQEIPREMAKQQSLWFLDWYGVKYMAAVKGSGEFDVALHFYDEGVPYLEKAKVFDSDRSVFVVSDDYTSPLIRAVNAPVVGFVGNDESYMVFIKDIAMLNLNTSYLIPVKMSDSISGISSDKLALVDALVIYDFKKSGLFYSRGWGKVLDFVRKGGRVWIEGGGNAGERENPNPPKIFPVTKTKYGPLGTDWEMNGELAGKVDPLSLEKLVYRNTPWQVSYTTSEAVKPGARVLLTQKGYPVAVTQDLGKGKVLWTGANFWYRPEEYRKNGMREVRFVQIFLEKLLGGLPQKRVQAYVDRPDPEHIKVIGQGFTGVVFKETNWPGWQATVEAGGKKRTVPILTAGPELMYISVPKEMRTGEIEVSINYGGDPFYWFCFFISLTSFLAVVLYLIFGGRLFRRFLPEKITKHPRGIKMKVSSWWESEEE